YQYFIESDIDGKPINRVDRSTIYQRAKKELETIGRKRQSVDFGQLPSCRPDLTLHPTRRQEAVDPVANQIDQS
ncbi:MAG: hypothetical protein OSW71_17240, partial [Proteobacteria bacterium]|nr:hypothetical protein [Pseudomonadota bacterium]